MWCLFVDLELNKWRAACVESGIFAIFLAAGRYRHSYLCSDVHKDGRLVGELHFFDAENWSVDLIVDPGQVSDGWSLSDSAELVVDGTVAQADPALVGTQVGHGNAAQMRADSRGANNARVAGVRDGGLGLLVELRGCGQSIGLVDLGLGQTTHENEITVPGGLEDLTRGQLRDIKLLVGITNISVTSDHLIVEHSDESLDAKNVVSEDETLDHVHLCTTHFIVAILFIPNSK